jgi:MFS family permease
MTSVSDLTRHRITAALFVAQSLFSASTITVFTLSPIIAAQLSGSDAAAGLPSTVNLLGRAAVAYPMGWLMDRLGRRFGLTLGFLIGAVGAAISFWAVTNSFYLPFLVGAAVMGAARGSAEQSRYVAAEVYPASRRARIMGIIVFAGTIGAVGGPQLVVPSGRLAEQWGLAATAGPFIAGAALLLLAMVVSFLFLRPDPLQIGRIETQAEEKRNGPSTASRSLGQLFLNPIAQVAIAAMLVGQLVMTLLMVITPLHMDHHHHADKAIANVIMAHTLGMFGLSNLTGWLIDRFGRYSMIVTGALLMVVSGLLAPLSAEVPMLALSLFLLGLGWNFCFIAGSSLFANVLAAGEQGRAQGASEVVVALASGAGSLGSGYLFERMGFPAVSGLGIGLCLALIALVALNKWRVVPAGQTAEAKELASTQGD